MVLVAECEEKEAFGRTRSNEPKSVKQTCKRWDQKIWAGLTWLTTGTSGRLLQTL
jgi:hypothetical protein